MERVSAPVVCGPVGFRKVPLQSRWGEYVRVTVAAPASLRGTVLVHAGGSAQEPQQWNTESTGALVIEARFPNEDVDKLFALERERPIDITLTGLEGVCEGAVFTVEHGALVPSIDERAWVAELERRGGPELAARREAARLAADARRQAHYAAWESRSVEVIANAALIREQHYAQWEAHRFPLPRGGEGQGEGESSLAVQTSTSSVCASGTCAGPSFGGAAVASTQTNTASVCASGTCAGPSFGGAAVASTQTNTAAVCASGTCSGPSFGGGAVVTVQTNTAAVCASGTCSGPSFGGAAVGPTPANTSRPALLVPAPATAIAVTSPADWNQPSELSLQATAPTVVTSPADWSQPSDISLRASVSVSSDSSWSQPFDAHLQPVPVTTESQVVTRYSPESVPSCGGECQQQEDPALTLFVPSLFQVMLNLAGSAALQSPPQHAARPVGH